MIAWRCVSSFHGLVYEQAPPRINLAEYPLLRSIPNHHLPHTLIFHSLTQLKESVRVVVLARCDVQSISRQLNNSKGRLRMKQTTASELKKIQERRKVRIACGRTEMKMRKAKLADIFHGTFPLILLPKQAWKHAQTENATAKNIPAPTNHPATSVAEAAEISPDLFSIMLEEGWPNLAESVGAARLCPRL